MPASKTGSKPKRVLKTVPCSESRLNVSPSPPMMTWAQAQALAKQINEHWDEPAFVKATAENAGNHGIITLSISVHIHGVRLKPVKTTWHFAPMMVHVIDMVQIAYNTAAEAVSQTRVHAADALKRDFLKTLQKYEQL